MGVAAQTAGQEAGQAIQDARQVGAFAIRMLRYQFQYWQRHQLDPDPQHGGLLPELPG